MEAKNCPYCGRRLIIEHERYCHHCDQDVSKINHEEEIFPKTPGKIKKFLNRLIK